MEYGAKLKSELMDMSSDELEKLYEDLELENEHLEKELERADSQQSVDIRNDIKDNNTKILFINEIFNERSSNRTR